MLRHRSASLSRGPRTLFRRALGERGAAAVEFAIVMPALLLLIFGMVDFGRALHQQIQLTEAVREAARVGALYGTPTDMQNRVRKVIGAAAPVTFVTTTVCPSTATASADAVMTVRRTYRAITPVFALMSYFGGPSAASTLTLNATGVMACLG